MGDNGAIKVTGGSGTYPTHTGEVTGDVDLVITPAAVTYAKIQDVANNNVLLGNDNGAGSTVQELTASEARTILSVTESIDVDTVMYVDGNSGDDANDGSLGNPKKTFNFLNPDATDAIPRQLNANLTVNATGSIRSAGTAHHTYIKDFFGSGTLTITGATSTAETLTVDVFDDDLSNIQGGIVLQDTGKSWSANTYQKMFVEVTSAGWTGYPLPIMKNTGTELFVPPFGSSISTPASATITSLDAVLVAEVQDNVGVAVNYSLKFFRIENCSCKVKVQYIDATDELAGTVGFYNHQMVVLDCSSEIWFDKCTCRSFFTGEAKEVLVKQCGSFPRHEWEATQFQDSQFEWVLSGVKSVATGNPAYTSVSAYRSIGLIWYSYFETSGYYCLTTGGGHIEFYSVYMSDSPIGIASTSGTTTFGGYIKIEDCTTGIVSSVDSSVACTFVGSGVTTDIKTGENTSVTFAQANLYEPVSNAKIGLSFDYLAANWSNEYDNTASGLTANTYQDAIDELETISGAIELDDLADVSASSETDKDILQYNAYSAQWLNVEPNIDSFFVDGINTPTDRTLETIFAMAGTPGHLSGAVVSDNGDGTIDITEGEFLVHSANSIDSPLHVIRVPAISNLALADNAPNTIFVHPTGPTYAVIPPTIGYFDTYWSHAPFALATRVGTTVYLLDARSNSKSYGYRRSLRESSTGSMVYGGGMVVADEGSLEFSVTAGVAYISNLTLYPTSAFDTSGGDTFTSVYDDGAGGWTRSIYPQTSLDSDYYDDGSGTLAAVTAGKYAVHWIYIIGDTTDHLYSLYGLGDYTLTEAQEAGIPASTPPELSVYGSAILVAKVIIEQGTAVFEEIQNPHETEFVSTPVSNHSELSGLQGGQAAQYYHLTLAQHTALHPAVTLAASATNGGLSLSTQEISFTQATTSTSGWLSDTDWDTFNGKQDTISTGALTEATSSVLTITNGATAVLGAGTTIEIAEADTTTSGYLSSTDWNTFNSKLSSNITHSGGDATGATVLTLQPVAISGKTLATAVGADHFLIFDADDNALKKALVSDILGASSGNTLDEAYDEGGSGSGRSITADSGPVEITNIASNTTSCLLLQRGVSTTGQALRIVNESGTRFGEAGASIFLTSTGANDQTIWSDQDLVVGGDNPNGSVWLQHAPLTGSSLLSVRSDAVASSALATLNLLAGSPAAGGTATVNITATGNSPGAGAVIINAIGGAAYIEMGSQCALHFKDWWRPTSTWTGQGYITLSDSNTEWSTLRSNCGNTEVSLIQAINIAYASGGGGGATSIDGLSDGDTTLGTGVLYLGTGTGNSGDYNTGIGQGVLPLITGRFSTGVGNGALASVTSSYSNTAVGADAGSLITGAGNCLFGSRAGYNITSGDSNVAMGPDALYLNAGTCTGSRNIAIGLDTMSLASKAMTANDCIGIGYLALYRVTDGDYNTAIGYQSMIDLTTGADNLGLGTFSLQNVTTGDLNIGIGSQAGGTISVSDNNIAIGNSAMHLGSATAAYINNIAIGVYAMANSIASKTANNNTAIGYYSLSNVSTGTYNTSLGASAGQSITIGSNNITIGNSAMYYSGTTALGDNNIAIGSRSMYRFNKTADCVHNIGLGVDSLSIITTGYSNIALGSLSLTSILTGIENVAIGRNSSYRTVGNGNTCLGTAAGFDISEGDYNVAIGYHAIYNDSASRALIAGYNIAIGWEAMALGIKSYIGATYCKNNIALGTSSLTDVTTGSQNICIGGISGTEITSGDNNIAIGYQALNALTTTDQNTAVGYRAGFTTTGDYNTCLGSQAGTGLTTGDQNVLIGYNSTVSANTSFSVVIGAATGNNSPESVVIGWSSSSTDTVTGANTLIGYDVTCTGSRVTAVGSETVVTANRGVAIGDNSSTTAANAIAIGSAAVATGTNSIAIGTDVTVGTANYIQIGNSSNTHLICRAINASQTSSSSNWVVSEDTSFRVTVSSSSSARYKEDIRDIEIDTSKIYDLVPRSFHYKDWYCMDAPSVSHGLIAEECYPVMPSIVKMKTYDQLNDLQKMYFEGDIPDGEIPEGVRYNDLIVPMLAEMQKLKDRIEELEKLVT